MGEISITNNKNGKKFIFRGVNPSVRKRDQPTHSIPLVGTSAGNNLLFRFVGQSEVLSFTFALFDDDTDVSDGTASPSQVKTPQQQEDYLMDEIYGDDFDVSWTFVSDSFPSGVTVNIENCEINSGPGSSIVRTGRIVLKRGRLGSA